MKPYFYALLAIVFWSTLAWLSLNLSHVPPFLLVGVSLVVGGACSLPWAKEWKIPFSTLAMGVAGIFSYHFFLFIALRNAPPVEANLINYLWPLLIVVLSPLFFKNYSLNWKHIVAAVFGFSGAFLVVAGGKMSLSPDYLLGYVLAALSALIWACYSLLSKKVTPFPTSAVGLFCLVSGVLSVGCHFVFESAYRVASRDIVYFLLLGLGPMGASFFLWDKSLKTGDPRIIGSLSYLTPMLSTLLLASSGQGQVTGVTAASMALIILGAILGAVHESEN